MFKEKIQEDLKRALREKKETEVLVLRQLLAAVLNKEKEKTYKLSQANQRIDSDLLTDEEVIESISSEVKKRRESIDGFKKGGRLDLVDKETEELNILIKYLPEQLSEEEIRRLVKEAILKIGAKEVKDTGKVMAELMPKIKGKADGSLVGKLVKELMASA